MRRLQVNNASLASASASAAAAASAIAAHSAQSNYSPAISLSHSRKRSPWSLRCFWLFAVFTVIQFHVHFVLGTAATAAATASISTAAVSKPNDSSSENNFYFDESITSRALSLIAADTAAPQLLDVSSMPGETQPAATATATATTTATRTTRARTTAHSQAGLLAFSTARLPGLSGNSSTARTQDPLAASAATTKSARSATVKQPIDVARSRNHWTAGGGGVGGGFTDAERSRTFRSKYHHENHYGPFFEEPSNLVDPGKTLVAAVHLFTEAVLNCRVGMLKDKTVMWVRRTTEKVSLLTVGNVTYSGDPRIRVKFQYPNNWRLMINPTQREDAGIYMCQVSTHPPRVFTTNLTILEPPLRIIDEHERDVGDRYYKSGSTVDLQCQISRNFYQKERLAILKSTELGSSASKQLNDTASEMNLIGDANHTHNTYSSQELEKYFTHFITWAKDDEPLQALTNRRSSVSDKWLNSRISISDAKLSDSGNYSCSLGRLFTVIVQVQVLTGELPAAVQHNLARRSGSCLSLSWSLFIIVICFYILKSHSSQFHSIKATNE
ncbi:PREDICTED: uncharacterized protein LOC108620030 [Drosophila arizonae]|uniref:Uncharacterized protein LOC108620030 n=1 Tax=Drosophila arizonae TaxID=7263 RepID=A0ABM1PYU4_DROAR|nr:PREDICTED: uncharacterized protein LOC108620030 [Drosophila arizonae]